MAAGGAWGAIAQGVTDIGKTVAAGVASKIAWKRQKRILKNQIQWRVADMRAAGLNPILAVTQGGSSPGSVGMMNVPAGGNTAQAIRAAGKFGVEKDLLNMQLRFAGNAADREFWLANKAMFDASTSETEAVIRRTQIPSAKAMEEFDKTRPGQLLRQLRRVRESVPLPFIGGSSAPRR